MYSSLITAALLWLAVCGAKPLGPLSKRRQCQRRQENSESGIVSSGSRLCWLRTNQQRFNERTDESERHRASRCPGVGGLDCTNGLSNTNRFECTACVECTDDRWWYLWGFQEHRLQYWSFNRPRLPECDMDVACGSWGCQLEYVERDLSQTSRLICFVPQLASP